MAFIKCSGGNGMKVAYGSFTDSKTETKRVNCGFQPDFVATVRSTNTSQANIYIRDYDPNKFFFCSAQQGISIINLGGTQVSRLKSIDTNGFTLNKGQVSGVVWWFAAKGGQYTV